MVREWLQVEPSAAVSSAATVEANAPVPPRSLLRQRRFDRDWLVEDAISVADLPGDPSQRAPLRTMVFSRDSEGQVIERDSFVGKKSLHRARWTSDAAGLAWMQRIFASVNVYNDLAPTSVAMPDDGSAMVEGASIGRSYDDRGELLETVTSHPSSTEPPTLCRHHLDTAGRLVRETVGVDLAHPVSDSRWTFDEGGRLLLHDVRPHYSKQAATAWYERHAYNAAGQPTLFEQGKGDAMVPSWRQTWTYAYEAD